MEKIDRLALRITRKYFASCAQDDVVRDTLAFASARFRIAAHMLFRPLIKEIDAAIGRLSNWVISNKGGAQ